MSFAGCLSQGGGTHDIEVTERTGERASIAMMGGEHMNDRRRTWTLRTRLASLGFIAAAVGTGGFAVFAPGCSSLTHKCDEGGCDNTTSAGGSGGSGGTGGGTPAECIPSSLGSGESPADTCGAFVSSSMGHDDSGTGSKAAPYATIGRALQASASVIYACTDGFSEAVTLPPGTSLYGGLDCAHNWTYVGALTNTPLTAAADAVPLTLAAGSGTTHVEDMDVTAAPAVAVGGSSIAVIASGATAEIVGSSITAGGGAAGESAEPLGPDAGLDGTNGENGTSLPAGLCNAQTHTGGAGGQKTCDGTDVSGGNGGLAVTSPGGSGQEGLQSTPGSSGDGGLGAPLNGGGCGTGQQGANGTAGTSGSGATGIGTIDALGYHGADGTPGGTGVHGQGGGGGGASACTSGNTGPSGGGGSSGGCGGTGGGAGRAAGSSIAVFSFDSSLTLTGCGITTAAGGAGGDGVVGQDGGYAGLNAGQPGGNGSCAGAQGGNGGPGGPGGGGHGGHSVGIAFDGGTAPVTTDSTFSIGALGPGGAGGDTPALDGDAGQSCQSLDFAQGAAGCTNG